MTAKVLKGFSDRSGLPPQRNPTSRDANSWQEFIATWNWLEKSGAMSRPDVAPD